MPRFPHFAQRVERLSGSVFEKFRHKMIARGSDLVRLHIGDTYLHPKYPLPIDSAFMKAHTDFNRYCNTFGVVPLRQAIVEKVQSDNHLLVEKENVMVTNGATNGLSATVMSLVDSGDEVLVLTPAWPFFFGMVKAAGGEVIEVPFYMELYADPHLDIENYLEGYLTQKTMAVYVNTPNNPSGKVMTETQLQRVAAFAQRHRLWIVSDEAYDGLTFEDRPHISIAGLDEMFDQTITVFTFSKSFMFAGLRLGFLVGSAIAIQNINKCMVHQLYSPATPSQYMMIEPIHTRHQWLPPIRQHYQELRDLFLERIRFKVWKPEGTYFLFFSIHSYLKGRDYWDVFDALLEAGVSVAPGSDFGESYEDYIRICFTGEPANRLIIAAERLNQVLLG